MDNDTLLKNRILELSQRAFSRGVWAFSDFLTLSEQDILLGMHLPSPVSLEGGFPTAERKIAVFGSEEFCGWTQAPPIVCVQVKPLQQKFADKLTHRDFLGSILSLGIRREVLGDIVISDNIGYVFCLDSISDYVISQLERVRHTSVTCSLCDTPDVVTAEPDISELVVASERLDAVVAAIYRLSRSQAQELISSEKVFLSGRLAHSSSAEIDEGSIVSVRGFGRFVYLGIKRETKKGRLRVMARIYK